MFNFVGNEEDVAKTMSVDLFTFFLECSHTICILKSFDQFYMRNYRSMNFSL